MTTRTLPRSTTYIARHITTHCSRVGCTWPGRYGTATGTRWCALHHECALLVETMQRVYQRDLWLTGKAWCESELMQAVKWIREAVKWIREAREDEIEMVCELYGLEIA